MAPPDDHAQTVTESLDHSRIRMFAAIVFVLVAMIATAQAQPKKRGLSTSPREALATQLAGEAESIGRALATVTSKLADVDALHTRRAVAAYRLVRDARTSATDPVATSRRRAAARLLLSRDLGERALLADEAGKLQAARDRVAKEQTQLAGVELPPQLARPARGAIARRFGTLVHEKSKATLARRGLDFDVEARADAVAPADGIVRFAGAIRGLDTGLIIDHGTYFTILGKLGELAAPVGASVRRGDRVGRAARQRVYFEVRVKLGPGGLPIDPEPLLAPTFESTQTRKR